jgi:hypothetical protein
MKKTTLLLPFLPTLRKMKFFALSVLASIAFAQYAEEENVLVLTECVFLTPQ